MPQEKVRQDDQLRDAVGSPISTTTQGIDNLRLAADEVPLTDPSVRTASVTGTVASAAATVDLAATPTVTIPDDGATITAVTYTPAGAVASPSAGNTRTYTLAGTEGTIATFVFDNTKSFVSGTPVSFTVSHAVVAEQTLTLASVHASSGVADPGGTLTVTYTM